MRLIQKYSIVSLGLLLFTSCASHKVQYNSESNTPNSSKEIDHTFYLIGDAGNSPIDSVTLALKDFQEELSAATKNSTALFLGDNIYPKGLPKKEEKGRDFAEHQLDVQIESVKDFPGRTIFIPGNHDWYSKGPEGLKRQERYVEDRLGKDSFLPENGCPIRKVEINEEVELIIVDTEWYITKWDKHPTLNDDCE
ncbi:MAG: metallophosphoesterase, partial [Eudoraea sp.]|uniref:metallophosphoesterase n=1 Tax=Eudoraea sp. TaxID=1979955 RepID=UPI003C75ADA9